jgi:ABC-2 type transport system permease protein
MATEFLPVFRRSLGDSWRSLLGWSIGVSAALMLYIPLYTSIGGNDQMKQLIKSLPSELVKTIGYEQISTGAGYTQATYFGLMGLLLLTIAATAWGTAAIAGDEETGSLELTLSHGVSRSQLVLERTLAIAVRLGWLVALSAAIIWSLNDSAGLGLELGNLVTVSAVFFGITFLSATMALAVGAITGRRSYATGAGAGVAVLGYAFNAVANQSVDFDWLHNLSSNYWAYGTAPLATGDGLSGALLLAWCSIALIAVSVFALTRRDITN